ncbi:hypothetical protein N9P03_01290 [bacterium]|nr:hypothetical protein [bacterium]
MTASVFNEIWNRQVTTQLALEDWDSSYFYNAATYFSAPLSHAFGASGTAQQQAAFSAHFEEFASIGFDSSIGWLAKGQYLTLVQNYISLKEEAEGGPTATTSSLAELIKSEVSHEWLQSTDRDWSWETWTGREEGINQKLASGEGRITDGDLYLLSIGARSATRDIQLGETTEFEGLAALANTVISQVGEFDSDGNWTFPSDELIDHRDHTLFHWDGEGDIPIDAPLLEGVSWDTSHASRWPAWFNSFNEANLALRFDGTDIAAAQTGFTQIFEDAVLYEHGADSGIWLTTNYVDGYDGVFRWGYQSFASDNGYASSQLSGTFLMGAWNGLGSTYVDEAYADLLENGMFTPEVYEFFNEPVRVGPSTNAFDWRDILESGDIRLWLAIASDTDHIEALDTVRIASESPFVFVEAHAELSLEDLLPDLSGFSGQMISIVDVAHRTGPDATGSLFYAGSPVLPGETLTIAVDDLANLDYLASGNAAGDRIYWRVLPDGEAAGSTWSSLDIARTNDAPDITAHFVDGRRNDTADLSDAISFFDSDGDSPGRFQLYYTGEGPFAGFSVAGHEIDADVTYNFVADQSDDVTFVLDEDAVYWVRQSDGGSWSSWERLRFSAENDAPEIVIEDQTAIDNDWIRFSDIYNYSDPNGDEASQIHLWDSVGSDSWWVDGSFVDATGGIVVQADANIWLRSDVVSSSQEISSRAHDGSDWSEWVSFNLDTVSNTPPELVIGDASVLAGGWLKFDDLFQTSDAEGDTIQKIKLWDEAGASSWWTDGAIVDANSGYVKDGVTGLWLKGDELPGEQTLWMKVYDGHHWSAWQSFTLTTTPNSAPVVDVEDQFVFVGDEPISAGDFVSTSDADGDEIIGFNLWDSEGDHSWQVNGIGVDATRGYRVSSLDDVSIAPDQDVGSQTLWVRAYDGSAWSEWDSFLLVTG